jgi:hypothetical protein
MCHRQDPLLAPGYMCEACTLLRLLFHFPATVHLERQRRQQLCSTCLPWGSRRVPMQQQREGRRDRRGVMPCKCRSLSAGAWSCHSLHTMWGRVRSLARQGQTWRGNKVDTLTFDGRALESCHWSTTPQPPGSKERSRADAEESPGLCCEEKQQQATHGRGSSSLTA